MKDKGGEKIVQHVGEYCKSCIDELLHRHLSVFEHELEKKGERDE